MIRSKLIVFLVLAVLSSSLVAQECSVKLRDAENLFNAGLVEEVPALLEDCLVDGFTKTEEHSAYQIIIRSYLFDDKIDMAEQTMLEFLKKNPEYKLRPTDNADFVYLFNKFRVKPVIQLGLRAGFNFTYIMGVDEQSVSGIPTGTKYDNDIITLALGGVIKHKLNNNFDVGLELDYSEASFKYSEDFLSFGNVKYTEKQKRIEGLANIYYNPWNLSGFIPYFKIGVGAALNLSTEGVSTFTNADINNPFEKPGPKVNRSNFRPGTDMLISAGIGCKYKLPSGYAFIDIDTRLGSRNQSIPGIPADEELYYYYKDDKFRTNILRFSMGYIFIIYKPEHIQE